MTACRVILDVMPGLQKEILESTDGLIKRCFAWSRDSPEPLQSYATGLLGAAMEIQTVATDVENRERNQTLVPLIINRLKEFRRQSEEEKKVAENSFKRPFGMFANAACPSSSPRKSPSRRISTDNDDLGVREYYFSLLNVVQALFLSTWLRTHASTMSREVPDIHGD